MRFIIYGRLSGTNEYTKANRTNRYAGAKMKQENESSIIYAIKSAKLPKIENFPISLKITWYEPNAKRDGDNISFALKFIQDAMVTTRVIPDDSIKYINGIEHIFKVDKDNPRIEVEILEKG